MKKISVVLYNKESDTVLTDDLLRLPSIEVADEQSSFDVALDVLRSIGVECCMMQRLFNSDELEIWQALKYKECLDVELDSGSMQLTSSGFVDSGTSGQWLKKTL
jgi:hypothetical protein